MPSSHLLLEEPIRMASILEPSKAVSFYYSFLLFLVFSILIYRSCFCDYFIDFVIIDLIEIVVDAFCRVFSLQ